MQKLAERVSEPDTVHPGRHSAHRCAGSCSCISCQPCVNLAPAADDTLLHALVGSVPIVQPATPYLAQILDDELPLLQVLCGEQPEALRASPALRVDQPPCSATASPQLLYSHLQIPSFHQTLISWLAAQLNAATSTSRRDSLSASPCPASHTASLRTSGCCTSPRRGRSPAAAHKSEGLRNLGPCRSQNSQRSRGATPRPQARLTGTHSMLSRRLRQSGPQLTPPSVGRRHWQIMMSSSSWSFRRRCV